MQPTLEELRQRYGNDVRIVFRHNPLPFHQNAMPAAEAAEEVYDQLGSRGFFAYAVLLFENQRSLDRATLLQLATRVGANASEVERALDDHRHRDAIQADQQLAQARGASGTPAFFINGRNVRGAQPLESFVTAVDDGLARARAALQAGTPRARLYEALIEDGAVTPQIIDDGPDPDRAAPEEDRIYAIEVPRRAPSRGAPNAPVTVQLFSDFQCPFCQRVRSTVDDLVQHYGRRIRLVWRDYPLPFHQNAMPAAEAAREVFRQAGDRGFWAFHDLLFDHQRDLSEDRIVELAGQVRGVDARRVRAAMRDHRHRAAVEADIEAVRDAGARIGTPSFFINGRLLQGAQPYEDIAAAIDRALAETDHH